MNTNPYCLRQVAMGTTAALAALLLASCASTSGSPKQVAQSNPTVTYTYRNDDELIQANQRAITYCNQHQSSLPTTQSFKTGSAGDKIVVFECVGPSAIANTQPIHTASLRQPDTEFTYNFWTDQELLDVSRDAQIYCMNSGSPEMGSNIVRQSDGSKNVTFRCN
jgi:ABC-type Fe3+-hydroxamate transport system substrate-binding protein